jgi:hypothetical protein
MDKSSMGKTLQWSGFKKRLSQKNNWACQKKIWRNLKLRIQVCSGKKTTCKKSFKNSCRS